MKGFLKSVLAVITGILIICIIASLIIYCASSTKSYKLEDDTVLILDFNGILKDHTNSNPVLEYLGYNEVNEIALTDIISAIKKAKENDKIKGIYIKAGYLSSSHASSLEVRNELKSFKESKKFIIAYGDVYPQSTYFLSSVADKIILNPQGNIDIHGIYSSRTFYKNVLDKIGVEMQIFKVGTYKSAVEPFMQDKMSDANREQVSSYINDIWQINVKEISDSRGVSVDKLNAIADSLTVLRGAELMIAEHLADTLLYESEAKQYLASLIGKDDFSDVKAARIDDMKDVAFISKNKSDNKIAILYAEGSIKSGDSNEDINDRFYIKQLKMLQDDEDIKAVVLRINSGGGSAYASEQIWKAVSDLKEKKPVVVSMGGYAASGGYYIACNVNKIVAQPTTLTGSIGIFGMFPNMEGLTKKIGLNYDKVKTNRLSDFGDVTRPMEEEEKAIFQNYINQGYDLFITRCSEGRGIPKDSIDKIAQGRVWTGKQALELGLVDMLGGIDTALSEASKLANIDDYRVSEYPVKKGFWEELFGIKKDGIATTALKEYFGDDYELIKIVKEIKELKEQDFIQARLPFDFKIE